MYRFIGHKSRTKEQLQIMMYHDEMDQWLAEANLEDTRARTVALRDRQLRRDPFTSSSQLEATTTISSNPSAQSWNQSTASTSGSQPVGGASAGDIPLITSDGILVQVVDDKADDDDNYYPKMSGAD